MTFREATDVIGLPLEVIATEIGRSYPTTLAYRQEQRRVPSEVWAVLARLARERASELRSAAREIANEAKSVAFQEREGHFS